MTQTQKKDMDKNLMEINFLKDRLRAFDPLIAPAEFAAVQLLLKHAQAELAILVGQAENGPSDYEPKEFATQKALAKLAVLEAGGVDNWEFYGDAMATLGADTQ